MKALLKWCIAAFALAAAIPLPAISASYPDKPIRIIVPFSPGGSTDIMARLVEQKLSEHFHQQVLVENRPGAGGNIGAGEVAKAAPNGYTLVMGSIGTHATNQLIYPSMPYSTVKDFAPITQVAAVTLVLVVHPSLPVKSVHDLIELVKKNPGHYNYASGGIGASQQLAMELFKYMTHTKIIHVPYKGSAAAVPDLLSGRVPMMFADLPLVLHYIKEGKLRALAVAGNKRVSALPDVPTVAEAGVPGYEANAWYGLFAPAGTPSSIINTLQAAVAVALKSPEVVKKLESMGARPIGSTPTEFRSFQEKQIARWRKVVKAADIHIY